MAYPEAGKGFIESGYLYFAMVREHLDEYIQYKSMPIPKKVELQWLLEKIKENDEPAPNRFSRKDIDRGSLEIPKSLNR